MIGKFLDKVYAARDLKGTKALYDEWSASYDAEVGEFGYVTPARCAAAREALAEARRGLALNPADQALKRLADDAALRAQRITDCHR